MRGFSLLELLLALTITIGLGMIGFQLFMQNERIFQNQNAATESEQNTRAVAFQIADEIRRAGQGVPIYAARFDADRTEATAIVLNGSDGTHLRIREGFSNVETTITTAPSDYVINTPAAVNVTDSSTFSSTLGTGAPRGRFAYIWGSGSLSCWSWIRAELTGIGANSLTLTPRQIGEQCHIASDSVRFTSTQTVSLEEAASIYLNAGSIWKTTATDMTTQTAPIWSSASELGRDLQELRLTYYDEGDQARTPATLADRLAIVRIDVRMQSRTGFTLDMRSVSRNARLR